MRPLKGSTTFGDGGSKECCIIVQQEKDRLAKLPEAERMEITLDNDATEQEVEHFLHGKSDENDMQ